MKTGTKGISYSATERKYLVRVTKNAKRVYLGRFSSLEEAKRALEEENGTPQRGEMPILAQLQAEFAPKKTKKSTKNNDVLHNFVTQKTTMQPKQKQTAKKEPTPPSNKSLFESILAYLLEQANAKKTSVFDVIVQEVARMSKK